MDGAKSKRIRHLAAAADDGKECTAVCFQYNLTDAHNDDCVDVDIVTVDDDNSSDAECMFVHVR